MSLFDEDGPTEDYEVYDILEWVEGSDVAYVREWPTYSSDWWYDEHHSHHGFAGAGFIPISVRTEWYGFLWLQVRKIIPVRCHGVRGGPSSTRRLIEDLDLDGM